MGATLACLVLLLVPMAASGPAYAADEEIICVGDSCQSLPPEPEDPTPGTLVPNPGNPPLRVDEPRKESKHRKKHRKKHHGGKHKHGKHGHARRPIG